jgi:hypothetical protein
LGLGDADGQGPTLNPSSFGGVGQIQINRLQPPVNDMMRDGMHPAVFMGFPRRQ